MLKFDISFTGVEVGAEVHEEQGADSTTATIRFYVEKNEKRLYIKREDAMVLIGIDQVAWMHTLNGSVGNLERE